MSKSQVRAPSVFNIFTKFAPRSEYYWRFHLTAVVGTDNAYNAPNQTTNAFTNLGIGNYLVTVTNHLTGCFVETTFEIEDPNTFEIATAVTDVICFGDNGTVSFTISDAINPYAAGFTWQVYNFL